MSGADHWGSIALALLLVAGCASAPSVPPAARAELASTGKLRVGLILSNEVLVTKDPGTGELRGVTVNLGKALAQRLGVPFEPVKSKVATVELADQAGVTIAVPERSAPDLFLSRNLKAAKVIRLPGGADAAIEALKSGKADAYAENAHNLSLYADRLPGARVLEGRYTVIRHAVATSKGKIAAFEYVKTFVEEAKADGTVAEAIRAAGLRRTRVASPSQTK